MSAPGVDHGTALHRVDFVRLLVKGDAVRAEAVGVGFRLPTTWAIPLTDAARSIAAGTPHVTHGFETNDEVAVAESATCNNDIDASPPLRLQRKVQRPTKRWRYPRPRAATLHRASVPAALRKRHLLRLRRSLRSSRAASAPFTRGRAPGRALDCPASSIPQVVA